MTLDELCDVLTEIEQEILKEIERYKEKDIAKFCVWTESLTPTQIHRLNKEDIMAKIQIKKDLNNVWTKTRIKEIKEINGRIFVVFNLENGDNASLILDSPVSMTQIKQLYDALGLKLESEEEVDIPLNGEINHLDYEPWLKQVEGFVTRSRDGKFLNITKVRPIGQSTTPKDRF